MVFVRNQVAAEGAATVWEELDSAGNPLNTGALTVNSNEPWFTPKAAELRAKNLHIAGGHGWYKFFGSMEGTLTSGTDIARRLAKRDGLWKEEAGLEPKNASSEQPAMVH